MKTHFLLDSSNNSFEAFRSQWEQHAQQWRIPVKTVFHVTLIIEELYSNFLKYGAAGTQNSIEITLEKSNHELIIEYKDNGQPFNPFQVTPPDINLPFEKRNAGGLGLHLVKNFIDSYSYTRKDNSNILLLTKTIR